MKADFLLNSPLAVRLYEAVRELPVIDWHNHLSVKDLSSDRKYADLAELWLLSDPYKHRAMRICGEPERLITGESSHYEKFLAWSRTLPKLAGNPLWHWSRMELERLFGIEEALTPATAEKIWSSANEQLKEERFTARKLLKSFNVRYAAPCAGFGDDLGDFDGLENVVPSLRGDDLTALTAPVFAAAADLKELKSKLRAGVMRFHEKNCRIADHALDAGFVYVPDDGGNEARFLRFRKGELPDEEKRALSCEILRYLGELYAEMKWTLQLHAGALRRTSSRLRRVSGPVGGYAGIGGPFDMRSLTALLDDMESSGAGLPRVFLYPLDQADHAPFAVLSGSFTGDGEAGKVRLGPAWWYCDHIYGMRSCFENVAAYGVLSLFPGMTTDSRSLLSFVRHDYFRRVFCTWLAEKAALDEMPGDFDELRNLAEKVCFGNAAALFTAGK